jgi:hypothetical protein
MANLKDSGMGGTMYKREDLMKGMDGLTEQLGDLGLGDMGGDMSGDVDGETSDPDAEAA